MAEEIEQTALCDKNGRELNCCASRPQTFHLTAFSPIGFWGQVQKKPAFVLAANWITGAEPNSNGG